MVDEVVKLRDVYQDITDTVIAQLELGVIPWRKTWSQGSNEGFFPTNVTSNKAYRGWNVFWLNMNTQINGYSSSRYITYKQAVECKGKVKKGEKGTRITYWLSMITKEKPGEAGGEAVPGKAFMVPKIYTVFNIDQCEGLDFPTLEIIERSEAAKIAECEGVIAAMPKKPYIKVIGSQPCYIPALDVVQIPHISQFENGEYYYSALFHELAHSTGHSSRLNRKEIADHQPGDKKAYASEELVAELTASFLNCVTGTVAKTIDINTSYIKGWLEALKNDKKLVLTAAARAQKAADFILDRKIEVSVPVEVSSVDTTIIIAEPVVIPVVLPTETGMVVYQPKPKQAIINYYIKTKLLKAVAAKFKFSHRLAILDKVMVKNNQAFFTDLEVSVVIRNVGIDCNDVFVIDKKELLFALESCPVPAISVDNLTQKITFNGGSEEINFNNENPLDYPTLPILEDYQAIGTIDQKLFSQVVKAANFLSKDEFRPAMKNVYVGDHVFGTDAHRLYFERTNHQLDKPILLSKKTIDIMRISKGNYFIDVSPNHIKLFNDDISIYQRIVNEIYPKCLEVIPTSFMTHIELDVQPLVNKLKIALKMANKVTHMVSFMFSSMCGTITAIDEDSGKDYSSVLDYKSFFGESVTIGFNGQFLLDVLTLVTTKTVNIKLDGGNRAVILDEKFLIMPVFIEPKKPALAA